MRRGARRLCALLFSLVLCSLLSILPVFAEQTQSNAAETLPMAFFDLLDSLPNTLRQLLPDGIDATDTEEVHRAVMEMSDFSYLFKTLLSLIGIKLEASLRTLCTVAGILILSALCKTLQSSLRTSVAKAFSLCSTCGILALLLRESYTRLSAITDYFSELCTTTSVAVPLLGTLYAMGGNVSTAVAASAGLGVFLSLVESLVAKTVIPFCAVCIAFTLVCTLDPSLRVGTLLSTVKKNYTTALTFLMMLLLTMISSQTVLAARADTLAAKSTKFAVGNLFPVLGGSVSELLRSVGAGITYLRGTVGICASLLLLLFLLPPLVELLILRLVWQLCASLADLLGCDTEKRLLEEFASVGGYLAAALCITSSVPILCFVILASCAAAIG